VNIFAHRALRHHSPMALISTPWKKVGVKGPVVACGLEGTNAQLARAKLAGRRLHDTRGRGSDRCRAQGRDAGGKGRA